MDCTLDVVLPCLDEAAALEWVLSRMPVGARPIVVDNGSTDGSAEVAAALGAPVVSEWRRGYGAACHAGLEAATAPLVAVMDCDATLDPRELERFVEVLVSDDVPTLAVGRRVPMSAASWPWRTGLTLADIGPIRVAPREALLALGLEDRRSGYPVETVVRAAEAGWRVVQLDVPYAARWGRSKVTGTPLGAARAVRDMTAVLSR